MVGDAGGDVSLVLSFNVKLRRRGMFALEMLLWVGGGFFLQCPYAEVAMQYAVQVSRDFCSAMRYQTSANQEER